MSGWHLHASGVSAAQDGLPACKGDWETRPVLVLPLDGLEETIARAKEVYGEHLEAAHAAPIGDPLRAVHSALGDLAHHVARALAGDGAR